MREQPPYDSPLQKAMDAFYHQHGPCCAGCDHWRFVNAVVGECRRSAPVSGAERWAMIGIFTVSGKAPEAGHIMTERGHHCGEFVDSYNWPRRR